MPTCLIKTFKSKHQLTPEAEQNRCGRSVAVFLVGVHAAVENPINFSAFLREVGMLNTCRLQLYIYFMYKYFFIVLVVQSLIRSTRPELDSDSIKKYASLWITIMNFSCQTDLPFSLEDRVRVSEVLDGQLVTAVSTIISRLNFSVNEMEDSTVDGEKSICYYVFCSFIKTNSFISMIEAESCPRNPADWQIFHNLADLLEDLLKVIEPRKRLQDLVGASDFIAKSIILFSFSFINYYYFLLGLKFLFY